MSNAKDPRNYDRLQEPISRYANRWAIYNLQPLVLQLHTSPLQKLDVRRDLVPPCNEPIKHDPVVLKGIKH